jgi:hypothetical protein
MIQLVVRKIQNLKTLQMAECRVRNVLDKVVREKQLMDRCLPCQGGLSQVFQKVSRQV